MINWIKKVLGIADPESVKTPVQDEPKHFHIDRHPVVRAFTEDEKMASKERSKRNGKDFSKMSKLEIDIWARNELGINLDRRRTKDYMIEQIKTHLDKEN